MPIQAQQLTTKKKIVSEHTCECLQNPKNPILKFAHLQSSCSILQDVIVVHSLLISKTKAKCSNKRKKTSVFKTKEKGNTSTSRKRFGEPQAVRMS